jgi:hypothetical protein
MKWLSHGLQIYARQNQSSMQQGSVLSRNITISCIGSVRKTCPMGWDYQSHIGWISQFYVTLLQVFQDKTQDSLLA